MNIRSFSPFVLIVTVIGAGVAGCATAQSSCPDVIADIPAKADSGATITVRLENLLDDCADTGGGPSNFKSGVELELVAVNTDEAVLATGTADVAQDGTASVFLTIPAEATGTASVMYDGLPLGTVSITE